MKRAFLSTVLGWGVGVVFMMVGFFSLDRPSEFIPEFLPLISWVGMCVAVVVFPTCLIVIAPLLNLLPRSSALWRPATATIIGAVAGPLVMYLLIAGYLGQMFFPVYKERPLMLFGGTSMAVGATFAFSYATSVWNSRKDHVPKSGTPVEISIQLQNPPAEEAKPPPEK